MRCELPIKLPIYYPLDNPSDAEKIFQRATEAVIAKLKDPKIVCIVETVGQSINSAEVPQPIILRGVELDFSVSFSHIKLSKVPGQESDAKLVLCGHFSVNRSASPVYSAEGADKIQASVLVNSSEKLSKVSCTCCRIFSALEETRFLTVEFKLEVPCYSTKELPLTFAVSQLIVAGLVDQLNVMKNTILLNFLAQHSQLRQYHFSPPGVHPITVIYELNYGETELKQVRKSLHLRLGLPSDRPLLRISNTINLFTTDGVRSVQNGSSLLKDVRIGIPRSGDSGGTVSLFQGSYEYYHYMQDAFNDSGWGCAYRSLQTIISWFQLQRYTSIQVPSHLYELKDT